MVDVLCMSFIKYVFNFLACSVKAYVQLWREFFSLEIDVLGKDQNWNLE